MENLELKNYIAQLNEEIDIRGETHKSEMQNVSNEYRRKIEELEETRKNGI